MFIEQINHSTVKIHITGLEMKDFNVEPESLCRNNPETQNMLEILMNEISDETDMETQNKNFFIEAFPQKDKSCIIFISAISENGIENLSQLYGLHEVDGLNEINDNLRINIIYTSDNLEKVLKILSKHHKNSIISASIYSLCGENRLILKCKGDCETTVCNMLTEFGYILGGDEILLAHTTEYFELIASSDNIADLSIPR